jgi:hypothetical protein
MSEDLSKKKSDSGWARIETGIQGCFSGSETWLEFLFDDSEKCVVEITFDGKKNNFFVEKSEAGDFLKKIIFLGRKAEVSSGSYWTKSVCANVEWRNLKFAEDSAGNISAVSNEWTIEEIEEALSRIKDAKIAEKLNVMLAKGLHRRAIEINLETEKFVKRLLSLT